MMFRHGELVAYAGRAGRVRGVESFAAAGASLDVLVIALTGTREGIVRIPLHRASNRLKRITAAQAAFLDENPPARTISQKRMQKVRAARAAKAADLGRLGGLAKARNRAA